MSAEDRAFDAWQEQGEMYQRSSEEGAWQDEVALLRKVSPTQVELTCFGLRLVVRNSPGRYLSALSSRASRVRASIGHPAMAFRGGFRMGERYTRKDAERAFLRLCKLLGKTPGLEPGQWNLDYAVGGFVVAEMAEHFGESRPLGDQRRNAREFWDAVYFVERVLEVRDASN